MGSNHLHVTCTCGTVLHLHPTCGTRWLTCHLTLAIHHKSLRSVLLHLTYGTRRLACHLTLAIHHKISARSFCIQLVGLNGLCVTCNLSPSLSSSNLWDPTVCVSLVSCVPSGFNFSKKGLIPGSRTWDLDQGLKRLYHCARRLAMLISLWSCYSILLARWMPYRLT